MLPALTSVPLTDNRTENRFELILDAGTAFMDYQDRGDIFYLLHTEVPANMEGTGAAAALTEKVFDFLKEKQLKAKIYCGYIQTWLKRHPEYQALIA